ncbi:MAG TPA: efflux RND transporter periplasmic adaptor subunit [Vicinamibacterales bacterium]|nr:efflux RND transporter periplasmic adaptor subunit [Vicinamibacterales bacterium]
MNRSRKLTFVGGGLLVVIGAAYGFVTLDGAGTKIDASKIVTVTRDTMVRSVVATGKVEPITKVEIKSKANGIIKYLPVDIGDTVKAGDVLAELDRENLEASLREAQANLQAARANLQAAQAELKKNVIEAEGPDVEFARRAYNRANELFGQHLIAQSQLDDAHSALDLSVNRQHVAQSQLVISRAKVAQADAQVTQAQAAADRAREDLANATIRAPINGTVLSRDVEVGSPVSSILNLGANATLVMTIGDIHEVFVRGKVDEADIGQVQLNQPARIRVETFKDKVFNGKVTQISPMGAEKDNVTTFEVKVSINNPGQELKANMTANAEIVLQQYPNSLIIPEAAVVYDTKRQPFVNLIAPDAKEGYRRVAVKLGVGNGTKTQVLSGVKDGDKLVLPG